MKSFATWGNELYSGKTSYDIIGRRKLWISIGLVLIVLSLITLVFPGLNPSVDFKGGSEFTISSVPADKLEPAKKVLEDAGQKDANARDLGSTGVRVQTKSLPTKAQRSVRAELAKAYNVDESGVTATTIGPSWGADVTKKAAQSLVIFLVLVAIVMALYFRTWTMAFAALFALLHDILLTGGVFALTQVEVSPATVIGLLTILGYSLYDTVVVFDKVRELTQDFKSQHFNTYGELVNLAVNQTLVRSINTSVVAVLPVGAILVISTVVLGGGTLRDISLALFCGMIVGTASSILIASPVLVAVRGREASVKKHTQAVYAKRAGKSVVDEDEGSSAAQHVSATPVKAGRHLGQAAQPKRTPRSKR